MRTRNKIALGMGFVALAALVVWALRAPPVSVELAAVERGVFEQSVSDDGKTRVRERYTVFAPLAGRLERIRLKAGDPVEQGQVVALLTPVAPALLDARSVQKRMQGFLPRAGDYEVRYQSIYRVHQRVAGEWRRGRVLLAGDAAHLNNPLGGFGLNSGIHDAVNLADKLAGVWLGEAGEPALDRYVRQRRTATIEQVQAMSIRNKRLLEERDPAVHRSRMEELVALANDPQRAREHVLETSMIAGLRKSLEIR